MSFRALVLIPLLCLVQAVGAWGAGEKPLRILTSFYPMYVMTLNVVGDTPGVTVECLTEPFTGCLHDYQLTPADLKKLATADLFIANGAGMETFLEKAVRQAPKLKIIEATKGIPLAFPDNPHLWVGISGAIAETNAIARGLAEADPARAAAYEKNAAAYVAKLDALRQKMHAALDGVKGREIITFHEAFPYFASEFGLKIAAVVEREPGSEPSAGELAATIRIVRQHHVRALFAEPQYPAKSAEVIRRETGVPVRVLDPAVTGPKDPRQAREAYLKAMETNLQVLREALGE
ncbi:MAG: zinc ABC transporter substrate-binding protein [Chthoniobacteraceae bacterium]|nr:zinc ABC transporter substrate-binding protein [Chthoniobacteraceae bacterium]